MLADKIASTCRTFRRRKNRDFDVALAHWKNDLAWLKESFYNPRTYDFEWPSTDG